MYQDDHPPCDETFATLRILHDDLDPAVVTAQLGIEPSKSYSRGEVADQRKAPPARIGGWFLTTRDTISSKDCLRHIDWLLDAIEPRADALKSFQDRGYETDIFCYWRSAWGHSGPRLLPGTLRRAGSLGVSITFDFYYFPEEGENGEDEDGSAPLGS